jgi:HlyD family secretion protein
MNKLNKKIVLAIIILIVLCALFFLMRRKSAGGYQFQTAPVNRTDLLVTISATGTLEPEEVIDVGAQVAGQIMSFGVDSTGKEVDYGSVVEEGTVLARIDSSLYAADVAQAEAQLKRAQADLQQLQVRVNQTQREWERAQTLGPSRALAETNYDAYHFAYEAAVANVAVGQATILNADAVLAKARRNLNYTTIVSPVKGVVIDRRVNIGQTVVSSLNAPSLFLIAKDLTRMELWVAVNEADIGNVFVGQAVRFSVDAFPDDEFRGEVKRIRLNASMVQNVVTYTVEVVTSNENGKLLPYLTANVKFASAEVKGVLAVPNAALRWMPREEQVRPEKQAAEAPQTSTQLTGPPKNTATVWLSRKSGPYPVRVEVGVTDGTLTEVRSVDLHEGDLAIIGEKSGGNEEQTADSVAPFTPRFLKGKGKA